MADSIMAELRKIPPVTRVLCASSVGVTLFAIMHSSYSVAFSTKLVLNRWELWRPYTSFFLGSTKLHYIFELLMLYRNSNSIESTHYAKRSADYAWQLFFACTAVLTLNLPLQSYSHSRALLHTLTYLVSALSPPGAQASIMGLVTIPIAYFPYAMLGMDLLMGGIPAAAQGVTGMIVGHVWWWCVWGTGTGAGGVEQGPLGDYAQAPEWLRKLFGETRLTSSAGTSRGGVTAFAPRRRVDESTRTRTGYNWGSGQRLGDS